MNEYQTKLKLKMDELAHAPYKETKSFPKEERYGLTSQLNRAALSIILNYIEGYGRQGGKTRLHFMEISYGSLREVKYLIHFCHVEEMIKKETYDQLFLLSDTIGKMLYAEIKNLRKTTR